MVKINMIRNNTSNKKPILCAFGYVDYIILASTIAIALAEELGPDDLSILATLFAVLSDELALISAVEETCNDNDEDSNNNESVFVPPVPAVSRTSKKPKTVTCQNKVKKRKKKVIRKKIKKK